MKNKNLVITLFAMVFISMMALSMMSAAMAVVVPAASAYKSGSFLVNCSYLNGTDATSVTPIGSGNSSIFFNNSAGTQLFSTLTGAACSANACWATVTTADLTDAVGDIRCSLGNETLKWGANVSVAGITLDDTNPSQDIKETTVARNTPINAKCSDTNIDAFSVSDGTTTTNLVKSTTDYITFTPTKAGTFTFTCTDLATNSASEAITVTSPEGNAIPPMATSQSTMDWENLLNNKYLWIIVIAALVIWALGSKK